MQPNENYTVTRRALDVEDYIDILRRHKGWIFGLAFHPDGDLLGEDPTASFSRIVSLACAAAEGVTDLDATVHCSFGDYPVREYFWQINGFRALRAHDIARIIGVDPQLSRELVQGVYDEIHPNIEEWRSIGVFPAPRAVADDAPLLDRLLAMTGRDPDPA